MNKKKFKGQIALECLRATSVRSNEKLKGQIALEYLIMVGLLMLVLVPVWAYVNSASTEEKLEARATGAKYAAQRIAESADAVYVQGPPAKLSIYVNVPEGTQAITFSGHEVSFRIASAGGYSDAFAQTLGELQGNVSTSAGQKKIVVEATDNFVNVTSN